MPKTSNKNGEKKNYKHLYLYLGIILFTFLFYGNSLKNQYNLDDQYVIVDKVLVQKGIAGIPKIFKSNYVETAIERHSYRPITTSSFAIEYQFFGANPFISHLINLLLYAFCCILIFRLVIRLENSEQSFYIASLAALIFLILPVHSEVVNNVKSRDELLCFSFGLLSLLQSLKYLKSLAKRDIALALLYFVLSLLSKKTSMTLIALIPFTLAYFKAFKVKKLAIISSLGVLCYAIPILFKKIFLNKENKIREFLEFENPLFGDTYSFLDRIPVGFASVGNYLEMILFPTDLSCYYGYDQVPILGWGSLKVWLSILAISGILYTIVYFWKRNKLISFGLIWFLVSISMFTNIVKPVVGIIADRFAFLPSAGIAIALAAGLYSFSQTVYFKKKSGVKIILYLMCAIIFGLSWNKVVKRNSKWYDKETLYKNDVKIAPKSAKLHSLYANLLFQKIRNNPRKSERNKLVDDAISHYKSSVEIYPKYATSWNNLATITLNEKKDAKLAVGYYENAIKYKKNYITALYSAGYAWELLKNYVKSLKYYQQASEINPNFQDVQVRISTVRGKINNSK